MPLSPSPPPPHTHPVPPLPFDQQANIPRNATRQESFSSRRSAPARDVKHCLFRSRPIGYEPPISRPLNDAAAVGATLGSKGRAFPGSRETRPFLCSNDYECVLALYAESFVCLWWVPAQLLARSLVSARNKNQGRLKRRTAIEVPHR